MTSLNNHRTVVRHAVKISAGRLASCGNLSFAPHAAKTIESCNNLLPPTREEYD